ncbi:hypothetical protein GCM10011506_14970 [Marivirga lumbricoides]|uniref:Uncharacterized protein n=1 Tax=Marivirga lumbricoides TaxID=1046115 RepID=A0ABQ1LX17_9BACT|nr:hypothetical protein GCM10011506_14970 [Marivirga lumbricoides]
MKNLIILFMIMMAAFHAKDISAQCCSQQVLQEQILPNLQITILNSSGNPVSSLSPGTNYTLRIKATSGTCFVSGSGCGTGLAPANLYVQFAFGCLLDGGTAPPSRGRDVGPSNNYTANINLTTLTGASFSSQITLLVNAQCTAPGSCGLVNNSVPRAFNFPN